MNVRASVLAMAGLMFVPFAHAATIFSDSFVGYGDLINQAPPGWYDFSDGSYGVESSHSFWWQYSAGNTTGDSPEGDTHYVRGFSDAGDGLATSINGFTVGQQYSISFYNAASVAFNGGDSYWEVFVDGLSIGNSSIASIATLQWTTSSLSFVASNTVHDIGFKARGQVNSLLDGVQVSSVSTVPVPAAVWLFGSGLLGLIGLAKRKAT